MGKTYTAEERKAERDQEVERLRKKILTAAKPGMAKSSEIQVWTSEESIADIRTQINTSRRRFIQSELEFTLSELQVRTIYSIDVENGFGGFGDVMEDIVTKSKTAHLIGSIESAGRFDWSSDVYIQDSSTVFFYF